MNFSEILSRYLSQYKITVTALSKETGISKSMLSRMKCGKKEPATDSETITRLAEGIAAFAGRCGDAKTNPDTVKDALKKPLAERENFDMKFIVNNLNLLIAALDFHVSDLSRHLNFDASYISLIRSGKRSPSDIASFCAGVADFVSARCENDIPLLCSVLDCSQSDVLKRNDRRDAVYKWLTKHAPKEDSSTLHFLQKLDSFDLNEYINALRFDESDAPANMSLLPTQKNYFDSSGFMQAELTWLQAVIASKDADRVLFYSDMPIEELSKNSDFSKRWMMGVALLLKKGIHIDMIHQIDRKESEMMLGLEAWIPLYMTGQVSPYYLKNNQNPYFRHFLRTSDAAALSGEAITGFYGNGCYRFSRDTEELAYYKERGANLLSKAQPLMEIYRSGDSVKYHAFIDSRLNGAGTVYRNILCAPPIYTIPTELLCDILKKNKATAHDVEKITAYAKRYRRWLKDALCDSTVTDELFAISESDFMKYPVSLPLSDLFLEREYTYTYEDYLSHIQQTEEFAKQNPGYVFSLNPSAGFRNIQIRIAEDKFVVISKEKSPTVHFVIYHPKLRNAIENLTIPMVEKAE